MQKQPDYHQLYNSMLEGFDAVNVNYFIMEIVCDENGNPVDGIYIEVSPATERLMGKKREHIIGKSRREFFGNVSDEFPAKFYEVIKTGQPVHFQSLGAALRKYYDVYAWKVADKQIAAIITDITERKKAEETLQATNRRTTEIIESIQEFFYSLDRNWNFIYVNKKAANLLGHEQEDLIGKNIWKVFPRALGTAFEEKYRLAMEKRETRRFETKGANANVWLLVTAFPSEEGISSLAIDITEHKAADETLKKQAALIDLAPDAIIVKRLDDFITFWSQGAAVLYGWTAQEVIGKKSRELFNTKFPEPYNEILLQLQQKGLWTGDKIHRTKDGREIIVSSRWLAKRNEKGEIVEILETNEDITERKKAEKALREHNELLEQTQNKLEEKASEVEEYAARMEELVRERTSELASSNKKLTDLLESMREYYFILDSAYNFIFANGMIASDAHRKPEELIGQNFYAVFPHWLGTEVEQGYQATMRDHKVRKFEAQSGATGKWYFITVYPAVDGIAVLGNEITDQKTLQAALKDQEKRLAAIGATAGMVGHDIRNPLQAIISDVFIAKSELEALNDNEVKKSVLESLWEIEVNTEYINKIVQDLQDYARPLNPKKEESDLEAIVNKILVRNTVENVAMHVKIDPKARYMSTDPYYLNRILYNLIVNAIQAMPKGGDLTVLAKREVNDTVITVADTGVGIPKDVQPKLFTIMFTTKSKGQGFGLPVVKRMTESLGGTVTFETESGRGTQFTLRLPDQKEAP